MGYCYLCEIEPINSYTGYFCSKCETIKDIMRLYPNVLETLNFCYIRNEKQIENKKELIIKKPILKKVDFKPIPFESVLEGIRTRSKVVKEIKEIN